MYSVLSGEPSARASGTESLGSVIPRSGVGRPSSLAPEPAIVRNEEFVVGAEGTPFVEIGGPDGPVFSAGPPTIKLPTISPITQSLAPSEPPASPPAPVEPQPLPSTSQHSANTLPIPPTPAAPAPSRTFPRLADTPVYLSVTFHDLTEQAKPKGEIEGADAALVALHFPDHPVSKEYRTLRDEIQAQLPDPTPRVLMFTAAAAEAGTTTVLLNLAVTIARETLSRVLVVDANLTRPAAAQKLSVKTAPGLVEVLAQEVPLAWAVQPTVLHNLQVLPAGGGASSVLTTIGHDLPKLIGQLREWYDWVLVDCGVWGVLPERDEACPAADAIYLVSREADVARSEFLGVRGWVRELGGLLRGYVTTHV